MVKVIKAKKKIDPFYSIKGFLVADSFHFLNINFNSFYSDNKLEILCIFYPKFAFLNINL